jgi:phosphate transport system permease protein
MSEVTLTAADFRGRPGRMRREKIVRGALFAAAFASVVISALIVFSLVREAWTFISQVEWSSLVSSGWYPRRGQYDIATVFFGSLIVTAVAMVIAIPVGLGSAIYLAEYASPRVRSFLKPTLEILAGIPSVVLGVFALTFLAPTIISRIDPNARGGSLAAAGLGVGILTIPLIASVSEDAMRSVPNALREASYGLGARKVTTSVKVVIPAAVSGLVAALIVSISRAIGETMVVFIAAGGSGTSTRTLDPLEPGTTMTAAMASLASGTDQVRGAALTYQSLFFLGLLLFLITLLLNVVADRFVRRVRQKY